PLDKDPSAKAMPLGKSSDYAAFSANSHLAQTNWDERCTICASGTDSERTVRRVQNQAGCRLNRHARLVILRMLYVSWLTHQRRNPSARFYRNETIARLWMRQAVKVQTTP